MCVRWGRSPAAPLALRLRETESHERMAASRRGPPTCDREHPLAHVHAHVHGHVHVHVHGHVHNHIDMMHSPWRLRGGSWPRGGDVWVLVPVQSLCGGCAVTVRWLWGGCWVAVDWLPVRHETDRPSELWSSSQASTIRHPPIAIRHPQSTALLHLGGCLRRRRLRCPTRSLHRHEPLGTERFGARADGPGAAQRHPQPCNVPVDGG